jgi:predicted AlkP superfamily pyrophosphatase or phosphodiesterase
MGDDTWMSVFPDTFEANITFPYDSFNVEDLHSVDEGVIRYLFPLLEDPSKTFDFLLGHFLGVDHVGHRVGPDHPSMKAKLQQMNHVHGMDSFRGPWWRRYRNVLCYVDIQQRPSIDRHFSLCTFRPSPVQIIP